MFIDIAINPMLALQRSAMFRNAEAGPRSSGAGGEFFGSLCSINIASLWDAE